MNLECPRCGKSPWNWAGETEDYCRCDEQFGGFLEQPPNFQQHKEPDMWAYLTKERIKRIKNGTHIKHKAVRRNP